MIASVVRCDLALCLVIFLTATGLGSGHARAQEGWPQSTFGYEDKKGRSKSTPAPEAGEALRPMDGTPRFGNQGRNDPSSNSYGGGYGNGGDAQSGSPSFAMPPAVNRTDLTPLEPVAPAGSRGPGDNGSPRDQGYRSSPTTRFGSDPGNSGRDRPYARPPAGGSADLYSSPSIPSRENQPGAYGPNAPSTSSSWSASTAVEAERMDPLIAAQLFKRLEGAPKSRTLRDLLRPVLSGGWNGPGRDGQVAAAAKIDAQLRLGFVEEAAGIEIPSGLNPETSDWAGFALRRSVALGALGKGGEACRDARDIVAAADGLPPRDKDVAIALSGYCGALSNTQAAVTLAADVARDRSGFDPAGLAGLEAVSRGSKPHIPTSLKLSPIAYRLLQKAGAEPKELVAAHVDAALLGAMPLDDSLEAEARIEAAEKSAAHFVLTPDSLANAYGKAPRGPDIETMPSGNAAGSFSAVLHRAGLYVSATRQPTPLSKVRLIRGFLDASGKAGLLLPGLEVMSETVAQIRPVHEIGWFAETAIEALLIGGRIEEARQWLRLAEDADPRGPGALLHWAALIDIADPSRSARRGESLSALEQVALQGGFRPADLHRLATVLDALDYQVPIPLWEAASRTPQPTDGHLPATGVLSQLQQAAKSGDHAVTVLLVAATVGPEGPAGAHMIALGDAIRALKRIGKEKEARRLGLEALFLAWPRSAQG